MRVIRPIANLNCDGARVSGISWAVVRPGTTIIGSVPGISTISPFTSARTERDRNQKQQQCRPFQSRFCFRSCLRVFNNIRSHNNRIRIRVSFHAPAPGQKRQFPGSSTWAATRCHDKCDATEFRDVYLLRRRVTPHPGRASRLQLLRIRRCSRRPQDCPGARTRQQCPMRSCGLSS
jgi:hypothetical protein